MCTFAPVRTTELGWMTKLKPEFDRRNTKIIGLSVDAVEDHGRGVPECTSNSSLMNDVGARRT